MESAPEGVLSVGNDLTLSLFKTKPTQPVVSYLSSLLNRSIQMHQRL